MNTTKKNTKRKMSEDGTGFVKDQKPYVVIQCKKCHQYFYSKTEVKNKKCPRCKQNHVIKDFLENSLIVNGITQACESVIEKQNDLAIKELGRAPDLKSEYDFCVYTPSDCTPSSMFNENKIKKKRKDLAINSNDYSALFIEMLKEVSQSYEEVPKFVIDMKAEEYEIPLSEIKILMKEFKKILIPTSNNLYKFAF